MSIPNFEEEHEYYRLLFIIDLKSQFCALLLCAISAVFRQ